ncbi:MAG: NADH-quinone oxidoreductase subunit J [Desulfurivibrio sp.]
MFSLIFFLYCAVVITGSGLLAITMRNPVHSVLMVLVLFFHLAGLYLTLHAEFLAAAQIIIYAGAILVLYLFVVFLVDIGEEIKINRFVGNPWLGRGIAAVLGVLLLAVIPFFAPGEKGAWPLETLQEATHTKALGQELFTNYILPFLIAGVILLVAVIGSLALVQKEKEPGENGRLPE